MWYFSHAARKQRPPTSETYRLFLITKDTLIRAMTMYILLDN